MLKGKQILKLIESRATFIDILRGTPRKKEPAPEVNLPDTKRYEITRKLGQGSSGVVYQVWDKYIERYVAIKISRIKKETYMNEVQFAGKLKHPNIVAIYDVSYNEEMCFITMEYIEGPNLSSFCNQNNLLPMEKAIKYIINICDALHYAHSNGVIHRDIKPANIMIDKGGITKITDFSVAQLIDKTMSFGLIGTPSYMSPEQLKDEQISPASDVFSLGCVLYELLKGKQAFTGENLYAIIYKVINEEPEPISEFRPQTPRILEQIVGKAISKDPRQRYASCQEFADELRIALRGIPGISHETKVEGLVDFIHRLDFFQEFPKKQIEGLISASKIVKTRKGHVVLSEGEISDTFYIILKGSVKVNNGEQDIASINAGQCFGEMACLGFQPRVANVIADQDSIFMKFRMNHLDEKDETIQLQFYKTFSTILVRRLSQSSQQKGSEQQAFSEKLKKAS